MSLSLKRMAAFLPVVVLLLTVAITASGNEYCKWTDENGVVHYDENCEHKGITSTVTTEGKRTESQKKAAEEHAKSLEWAPNETAEGIRKSIEAKSEAKAGATALSVSKDSKDISQMSADQLDVVCQQKREALIAPERERLIQDCIENKGKSQEYCERYFADYGNAHRLGTGMMQPALYMDLPECVAAFEARKRENRGGS